MAGSSYYETHLFWAKTNRYITEGEQGGGSGWESIKSEAHRAEEGRKEGAWMTASTEACVESVKHASSDRKDGCKLNRSLLWTWEEKHSDSCVGGRWLSRVELRMETEECKRVASCSFFKGGIKVLMWAMGAVKFMGLLGALVVGSQMIYSTVGFIQ